jgi:hypothetical protein
VAMTVGATCCRLTIKRPVSWMPWHVSIGQSIGCRLKLLLFQASTTYFPHVLSTLLTVIAVILARAPGQACWPADLALRRKLKRMVHWPYNVWTSSSSSSRKVSGLSPTAVFALATPSARGQITCLAARACRTTLGMRCCLSHGQ